MFTHQHFQIRPALCVCVSVCADGGEGPKVSEGAGAVLLAVWLIVLAFITAPVEAQRTGVRLISQCVCQARAPRRELRC